MTAGHGDGHWHEMPGHVLALTEAGGRGIMLSPTGWRRGWRPRHHVITDNTDDAAARAGRQPG